MSTESLDLAALKELCEKASPAPWTIEMEFDEDGDWPCGLRLPVKSVGYRNSVDEREWHYAHDEIGDFDTPTVQFIAASRAAVPALIAEVERLRETLDKVREKSQRWKKLADEGPTLTPAHVGYDEALRSCADDIARILASFDADHTDTKEQQP